LLLHILFCSYFIKLLIDLLTFIFSVIGTLFVICYSAPVVVALIAPLLVIFYFIQRSYMTVSRQLKRMVSISRSPINSSLTESFNGATTIRAYKLESRFIEENNHHIETSQKYSYPEITSNSWLFSRLEMICSLVIRFPVFCENIRT